MIFPRECKQIGYADTEPCGKCVYFLSEYLVHKTGPGHEIIRVRTDPGETGLMRKVISEEVLASGEDVTWYPERVNITNRAELIRLATGSGRRCTIFSGHDEHMTFVLDPDPSAMLTIHVYDVRPPLPALSARVSELEATGLFGELDIMFVHHLTDISQTGAEVHPCRAAGFSRTLDADRMVGGETIAGCRASSGIYRECYGDNFTLIDICPIGTVREEPFITRCCQKERGGIGRFNGKYGAVVHWGATPGDIFHAIEGLVAGWRSE
ncbi:MAG: hypothetical protein MUF37_06160 [Methanoregulaceae archaeon]|nr:hypothetical protein [Methanoregulaceae archaeon]